MWRERFQELTRHARSHFEQRDWHAIQRDSGERLDLYGVVLDETLARLDALLGERLADRPLWVALRGAYEQRVSGTPDQELAETFFNSVTRRIFHTINVDPAVAFVRPVDRPAPSPSPSVGFEANGRGDAAELFRRVLRHFEFAAPWDDLDGDAGRIAAAIAADLEAPAVRSVEFARAVFYRNKGAYLVGRLTAGGQVHPLVLALANPEGRVTVDAVLLVEDEVSIVFSFAHSYFLVEMDSARALVDFLRAIMPRKPVAELFNAVGCNRHGKTELYRSLLEHLAHGDERFEFAPGQRGMVMCVFVLPGFDVVFKVLRDRFDYPKTVTHAEVLEKYRLVFRHDRAGRLVDAQEFEHLAFERRRFSAALLAELTTSSAETVRLDGDRVVFRHLFTERRLNPLDVHLAEASSEAAREAVVDYGQVLRDLAATNIFPGDMLLKNFGVSRHGRLIFYDYDELCLLTVGSSRVDLQACKLEYSIVSPK